MRRLCVILCFSLFASIIHAAVMPMGQDPVITVSMDSIDHHCGEIVKSPSPDNSCHGDSYQCCLGFVVPMQITLMSLRSANQFNPSSPKLFDQERVSFIFKPPRVG